MALKAFIFLFSFRKWCKLPLKGGPLKLTAQGAQFVELFFWGRTRRSLLPWEHCCPKTSPRAQWNASQGKQIPLRGWCKCIPISLRFSRPSRAKLPGVTLLRRNTYPGPAPLPWATQSSTLWLSHSAVTPLGHLNWSFPFPLFMWMQYRFVQTFKTLQDDRDSDTSAKAPSPNSLVNFIGASSDCRYLYSLAMSV